MIIVLLLAVVRNQYETLHILHKTIGRDLRSLLLVVRFMFLIKLAEIRGSNVLRLFSKMVDRKPDKVILRSENTCWTFKEVLASYSYHLHFVIQDKTLSASGENYCKNWKMQNFEKIHKLRDREY